MSIETEFETIDVDEDLYLREFTSPEEWSNINVNREISNNSQLDTESELSSREIRNQKMEKRRQNDNNDPKNHDYHGSLSQQFVNNHSQFKANNKEFTTNKEIQPLNSIKPVENDRPYKLPKEKSQSQIVGFSDKLLKNEFKKDEKFEPKLPQGSSEIGKIQVVNKSNDNQISKINDGQNQQKLITESNNMQTKAGDLVLKKSNTDNKKPKLTNSFQTENTESNKRNKSTSESTLDEIKKIIPLVWCNTKDQQNVQVT